MNKMVRIAALSAMLLVMVCSVAFASAKVSPTAEISTAHYTDRSFDHSYPQVTRANKKAEEKITARLKPS